MSQAEKRTTDLDSVPKQDNTPPGEAEKQKGTRLVFIDNLRVLLTVLVIMHHLAITYGASGSWYFQDPAGDEIASIFLSMLAGINQAFFMGFFFLISAYFTPASYERKGAGTFLRDRFLRLGIPLVVYGLVLHPIVIYIAQGMTQPYWNYWGNYLLNLRSIGHGPLWFVEALLIFACLYALWRWLMPKPAGKMEEEKRAPGSWEVLAFLVGLAIVSFVVRIWLPVGWNFEPLNFQFPFFPQYIALYILGIIAYRRNWFRNIPDAMGRLWMWIAIAAIFLFPIISFAGGAPDHLDYFFGGFRWQAFVYALWEEFVCMGLCIMLLVLFRKRFNQQRALGKFLSANAYIAYIIHPLIIVSLAVAFQGVQLYPLLKYLIAVLIAVPLCFMAGQLIRKIPYANRIL